MRLTHPRDWSLTVKVTLMLAVVFTLVMVAFLAVLLPFQRNQHRSLIAQHERLLTILRDNHQRDLIHDILGENPDSLAIDLADLARQGGILWIRLEAQTRNGTVAISATADEATIAKVLDRPIPAADPPAEAPVLLIDQEGRANIMGAGGQRLLGDDRVAIAIEPPWRERPAASGAAIEVPWNGGWALASTAPLRAADETFGRLSIVYSLADVTRSEAHTRRLYFGILATSFVAVVLLLNLLLARVVIAPVRRVMAAMSEASKGDLRVRLPVHSRDEVGTMASSFNGMVGELEVAKRDVEDQSRILERMVGERTRALRESEARLLEVKNRLATILANVAAGVISLDEDGRITTFNERAGEILNLPAAGAVGRTVVEALEGGDRGRLVEFVTSAQAEASGPAMAQIRLRLGEGTRTLSVVASPLASDGVRQGTVVVFDDLTQILATQRLEAWKEAVERVIHEIKNPLTPVGLAAQTLRTAHAEDPARFAEIFPSATQMILDSVRDLKALIAEFTQFSRLPKVVLARVDANQVVRDVLAAYTGAGPIRVVADLAPGEIPIEADLSQFRRVLINVLNNAFEAMEGKTGEITIASRKSDAEGRATISVADRGCGVEDVERIFEPYYTTKVKGTGLGLAIARQIVEDHGGTITAKSQIGVGTTVSIHLSCHLSHLS